MAEVLGTVASGIGVAECALSVAGAISKLRKLWKDVQDAPETINSLKGEVNVLGAILSGLENGFDAEDTTTPGPLSIYNNPSVKLATSFYREALADLQTLVADLSREIDSASRGKRVIAKLRIVLKKNDVDKFPGQDGQGYQPSAVCAAELTVRSPELANHPTKVTHCHVKPNNSQPTFILEGIRIQNMTKETIKAFEPGHVEDEDISSKTRHNTSISLRNAARRPELPWQRPSLVGNVAWNTLSAETSAGTSYRVRFQPPKWFSQKAWDLTFNALTSGWQMNLATFNVIPEDSLVFEYAQVGNLAGLRKLFADGLASPLDYNPNGWTILDNACLHGQVHIVHELMKFEQVKQMPGIFGWVESLGWMCRGLYNTGQLSINTLQPVLNQGWWDLVADSIYNSEGTEYLNLYLPAYVTYDADIFNAFRVATSWYDRPPSLIFDMLLFSMDYTTLGPDAFSLVFHPSGHIVADVAKKWAEDNTSLIHTCFYYFGFNAINVYSNSEQDMERWTILLKEAINTCDDLHLKFFGFNDIGCTKAVSPFYTFLLGVRQDFRYSWEAYMERHGGTLQCCRKIEEVLQKLMEILGSCGVDLLGFGEREVIGSADYLETREKFEDVPLFSLRHWRGGRGKRLRAIRYGVKPEDWGLEWGPLRYDVDINELIGDFWNMIESPSLAIPGAWPDEPDYCK